MELSNEQKMDDVYKRIGELGLYQMIILCLVGISSFIMTITAFGYSFYGAVPDYR